MLIDDLVKIFKSRGSYNDVSVHELNEVNGKFDCILIKKTSSSKVGFYKFPARQYDTEEMAIKEAILHARATGQFHEISIPSIDKKYEADSVEDGVPKKRKRRTKAEMEEDKKKSNNTLEEDSDDTGE